MDDEIAANGPHRVRRVMTIVLLAAAAALAWVLLSTLWLWRIQERVVFQPPAQVPDAPLPARRVEFPAADGLRLFGYVVAPAAHPTRDSNHTVVLAFHGNADLAAWQVPWARELANRTSVTVVLAEYRGYAGIPGPPTYESAAADSRGALAFVRSHLRPARLVLFGHSLGSAVATELAADIEADSTLAPASALVLQSPFTSARDMAARMLVPPIPWLWRRISRVHYDTRTRVARLESPVYVAHGSRDVVIPARMGRAVFSAARRPIELLIVQGAGHNDVADIGGERYWRWLESAVRPGASASIGKLEEKRHWRLP